MNKNATFEMEWHTEHYPDIDLRFELSEDSEISDIIACFKAMLHAMGYSSNTIENYMSDEN